jgi:hypothetical protein
MKGNLLLSMLLTLTILLSACSGDSRSTVVVNQPEIKPEAISQNQEEVQPEVEVEVFKQSFEYYEVDKDIEARIKGISWREGSPVTFEDLRYVRVAYWDFDGNPQMGELLVNKAVAKDIAEIFEELYNAKFPIEQIRLIDDYNAEDIKSMEDNNTSAFCFREVEGKPGKLSKHSYGLAIDINPVQNPYVYKDKISPKEGKDYLDRSKVVQGMITKGDVCYNAFVSRGWTWGGDWKYEKDYQHFQKDLK